MAKDNPFNRHGVAPVVQNGRFVVSTRAFGATISVPMGHPDLHVVSNVVPKQIDVPNVPIVSMQQFTCHHVRLLDPEQPLRVQFTRNQALFAFDERRLHSAQMVPALVRFTYVRRP